MMEFRRKTNSDIRVFRHRKNSDVELLLLAAAIVYCYYLMYIFQSTFSIYIDKALGV